MNVKVILTRLKDVLGFDTDRQLAEFLEIERSVLSNWYKRNTLKIDVLLSKCESMDLNYILTGQSYKAEAPESEKAEPNLIGTNSNTAVSVYKLKTDYMNIAKQSIPLFRIEARAGLQPIFLDSFKPTDFEPLVIPNAPKCDGAVYAMGDSMSPIIQPGDIICYKNISNFDHIVWGQMYLIDWGEDGDDHLAIKYIRHSEKGEQYVKLMSENPLHEDFEILKHVIRGLALIKASIRYHTMA